MKGELGLAVNANSLWSIEDHTRAKHVILRKYLQAWFPIMHSLKQKRLVYIDGFAGPGKYEGGEDGSPLVALTVFVNSMSDLFHEKVPFWLNSMQLIFCILLAKIWYIQRSGAMSMH